MNLNLQDDSPSPDMTGLNLQDSSCVFFMALYRHVYFSVDTPLHTHVDLNLLSDG